MDGEQVEWTRSGWQLSCRVVVVSVVDRFRGTLVPVLGANGTSSDWYCGLAGRGWEALDTGRKQPPEKQKMNGSDSGCSLWFVLSCCVHEENSLNGSQCCIDFGSRAQVEGVRGVWKVLSSQDELAT